MKTSFLACGAACMSNATVCFRPRRSLLFAAGLGEREVVSSNITRFRCSLASELSALSSPGGSGAPPAGELIVWLSAAMLEMDYFSELPAAG